MLTYKNKSKGGGIATSPPHKSAPAFKRKFETGVSVRLMFTFMHEIIIF